MTTKIHFFSLFENFFNKISIFLPIAINERGKTLSIPINKKTQ